MRTQQAGRYSSRTKDLGALCDGIEQDVSKYQNSLTVSIRAAIEPVVQLPEAIVLLESQGRHSDVPKISALVKAIAIEGDVYLARKKALDEEFETLRANRPSKKGQLSSHSCKAQFLGHRYISLSQEVTQNLTSVAGDYFDLINPSVVPEEAVS